MIEASPEYLLNVVDEETAIKIWDSLAGMRIYFKSTTPQHYKINNDYKLMMSRYTSRANAVKQLMSKYEMSESQIRNITKHEIKKFFK
jgi:Mor family transcriptional regulator